MNEFVRLIDGSPFLDGTVNLSGVTTELATIQSSILTGVLEELSDHNFRQWVLNASPPKRPGYSSFVVYRKPSLVVRINFWESNYIGFLKTIPTVHTHNWHMVSVPIVGR